MTQLEARHPLWLQVLTAVLICVFGVQMDVKMIHFHHFYILQVCNIQIEVVDGDKDGVNLIAGKIIMAAERDLPKYVITDDSPVLVNVSKSEVHMEIIFKRRLTSETMMTFFPSFLLISFSYATSFFRLPNFFNTAIATNLTVMLTMTNLMSSVLTRLAQTSYIKWIEYWLIFAQLVPFVQVIIPIVCIELVYSKSS